MKVLVTGAAGMIGTDLVPALARRHELRLFDRAEMRSEHEVVIGDLTDPAALERACAGVEAVVHLAAATWEYDVHEVMIPVNVAGTWNVFDAARRAGVQRIVFASTHHTVGIHHADETLELTERADLRPDTFYAVTKVYGEALARHFSERYRMHAYCLRIGFYMSRERIAEGPSRAKEALVLSARDFAQIVERCLAADQPRFGVYNTISNARRPWLSIERARRELGYTPEDSFESIFPGVPEQPGLTREEFARQWGFDPGAGA